MSHETAPKHNPQSRQWCVARCAEVRRWVNDVDAAPLERPTYRAWLIELLSQLDRPPAATPAPTAAPEAAVTGAGVLSAERLGEIQELAAEWEAYSSKKAYTSWPPQLATTNRRELLAHAAALTARLASETAAAAEAKERADAMRENLEIYRVLLPEVEAALDTARTEATALTRANQELRAALEKLRVGVYTSTPAGLPKEGVTVLLQPRQDWMLPEFGRLKRDEHGPYWNAGGRTMKYDLSNWPGWAYLPEAPIAPAAASEAGPAGAGDGAGVGQVPGMPHAKCHGCGLASHVARCQRADCGGKEVAGE